MAKILHLDDSNFREMARKKSIQIFLHDAEVGEISDLDKIYDRAKLIK